MPTKRKITKLLVAALVFALADAWIWSSLRASFRGLMEESRFKEITLFARTAPLDALLAEDWLASLPQTIPGSRAALLSVDAESGNFQLAAADQTGRRPVMAAAAKAGRQGTHVNRIGGRAGDELHSAANGDQHEQRIRIQQIAQLVGDGGQLFVHLLGGARSDHNGVSIDV